MGEATPAGVIIVTGGSRGIGAATARLAASRGYAVSIGFLRDERAALGVVDAIRDAGGRAISVRGDMTKEADVIRLFDETVRQFGAVTALVNNAGILERQTRLDDMEAARFERVFATNITGLLPVRARGGAGACRRATAAGRRDRERVLHGRRTLGSPGEYVDYAASKGAIDTLTIGLATEVAEEGIRVNAVRPGVIYTDHPRERRRAGTRGSREGRGADEARRRARGSGPGDPVAALGRGVVHDRRLHRRFRGTLMDIQVTRNDGVLAIGFNRPAKRNALTAAMYAAMADALAAGEADAGVRVVLFHGSDEVFTAGNDLEDFLERPPRGEDAPVFRFLSAVTGSRKPLVAAVNGPAVGLGTTLLLHCDLVYAADTARFAHAVHAAGPGAGVRVELPAAARRRIPARRGAAAAGRALRREEAVRGRRIRDARAARRRDARGTAWPRPTKLAALPPKSVP